MVNLVRVKIARRKLSSALLTGGAGSERQPDALSKKARWCHPITDVSLTSVHDTSTGSSLVSRSCSPLLELCPLTMWWPTFFHLPSRSVVPRNSIYNWRFHICRNVAIKSSRNRRTSLIKSQKTRLCDGWIRNLAEKRDICSSTNRNSSLKTTSHITCMLSLSWAIIQWHKT